MLLLAGREEIGGGATSRGVSIAPYLAQHILSLFKCLFSDFLFKVLLFEAYSGGYCVVRWHKPQLMSYTTWNCDHTPVPPQTSHHLATHAPRWQPSACLFRAVQHAPLPSSASQGLKMGPTSGQNLQLFTFQTGYQPSNMS